MQVCTVFLVLSQSSKIKLAWLISLNTFVFFEVLPPLASHTSKQIGAYLLSSPFGSAVKQEAHNKVLPFGSHYCGKVLSQIWICVPRNQGPKPVFFPSFVLFLFTGTGLDRCDTLQYECKRGCGLCCAVSLLRTKHDYSIG